MIVRILISLLLFFSFIEAQFQSSDTDGGGIVVDETNSPFELEDGGSASDVFIASDGLATLNGYFTVFGLFFVLFCC